MIDRLIVRALEWAAGHADEGRYSPVAIAFHWTMALLVVVQLAGGWWMGKAAAGGDKLAAYGFHFALGVLMLLLVVGRAGWRLLAPGPINDADKPGWQSTAAHVTHYLFYLCLFGLPLSGWAMVSATAPEQLRLFGVVAWPPLPLQSLTNSQRWALEAGAEWVHWGLIVTLLALIPVHVAGAVKHHIIDRDDVLHAMAPIVAKRPPRRARWERRYRAVEKRLVGLTRSLLRAFLPKSDAARRPS